MLKIFYDPIYNFHPGFHNELIISTKKDIEWKSAKIVNNYEFCLRTCDPKIRKNFISEGYFKNVDNTNLIFSPHVFLLNRNPYFLEIEDIYWFFGDTYKEVYNTLIIPKWKKEKMEKHFLNKNLIHVFWWSKESINRFKNFCKINEVSYEVFKRVLGISSVLYPASLVLKRKKRKENKKIIVSVFNDRNFYRKGGDITIFLMEKLLSRGISNFYFKIFGSIRFNNFNNNNKPIKIIPQLERTEFQKELSKSDIFLFPSRADTFGTVLVDAMNVGCFIIASYGRAVFSTREILLNYPNKILIRNIDKNRIYDEVNRNEFFHVVENILKKGVKIKKWKSNFTRDIMRKEFLKFISDSNF